jgi:hypothetical protein
VSQEAGQYLTPNETYEESPCVFFVDGGRGEASCSINDIKPRHAVETHCWERTKKPHNGFPVWTKAELVEIGWDGFEREDYEPSDEYE